MVLLHLRPSQATTTLLPVLVTARLTKGSQLLPPFLTQLLHATPHADRALHVTAGYWSAYGNTAWLLHSIYLLTRGM